MAKLAIFKHGELVNTLELSQGTEYFVGRGKDCDFVLDGVTGISRQHFKLYHNGSQWAIEVLSKFGNVIYRGANVEQIELENRDSFSTATFEFQFESEQATSQPPAVQGDGFAPAPTPGANSNLPQTMGHQLGDLNENTQIGKAAGKPYIKIQNRTKGTSETLRLEGNVWIAGRDSNCEIVLKERGASRHHFELSAASDGFFIRDLNSANGTQVNGTKILSDQPHPIQSGDVIDVLSLTIQFQIRDPNYDQMLGLVPSAMIEPMHPPGTPMAGWDNVPAAFEGENSEKEDDDDGKKKFDFKKHRIKIATAVILLLALYVGLGDGEKIDRGPDSEKNIALLNLPKEQQEMIKNSYEVAKEQRLRNKCELALPELKRIHELIPFYKDSKDLETECVGYLETIRLKEEIEERKRQQRELEAQVQATVEECQSRMTNSTTLDELDQCLGDAPSLMPDHVGIQQLRATIEERELEAQRKAELAAAYQARVRQGVRLYNAAATLEEQGKDYAAIQAYEKFLAANKPDPDKLKPRAKRSIASLKETMSAKIEAIIEQSVTYFEQTQFQKGMFLLNKGLKINPKSKKIKSAVRKYKKRNDREMKLIYDDSILEESLGNIESAKDKWRRILELSYSGSGYYKKAKIKLKRYGDD